MCLCGEGGARGEGTGRRTSSCERHGSRRLGRGRGVEGCVGLRLQDVVTVGSPPPPLHQLRPVRFKYFIVSPGKAFIYKARVFHSA